MTNTSPAIEPHPLNANDFVVVSLEVFCSWLSENWTAPADLEGEKAEGWNAAIASIGDAWGEFVADESTS